MIGFQINNEFLDLPENPSVELNRNSPIFQQEGFVLEDYTLPITFPNTPKNSRILGWPHIVENAQRTRAKWDCILFYNGVPRLKGELRAKSPINHRNISANFVRGISQIGEDVKERSIRDIVSETVTIHNQSFQKFFALDFYTGGNDNRYALIINGKTYEGETMAGFLAAINDDEEKTFSVSSPQPNRIVITNDSYDELDPFEIEEFSYGVDGERRGEGTAQRRAAWQWVEVPQWSIDYNNLINAWALQFIGNDHSKPFRLGTIYNRAREIDIPQVNASVINFIDPNGLRPNIIQSGNFDFFGEVFSGSSIAPFLTIDHVFKKIEEYYNITIEAFFRDYDNDDPFVFIHSNTIDHPMTFLAPFNFASRAIRSRYDNKETYKASNLYNFYRREFNLSEFVPDMTVNDLLKALQVYFNTDLNYDNDSRTLSYTNRKQYVQQREYIDITDRCEIFSNVQNPVLDGVKLIIPHIGEDKLDTSTLNVVANPFEDHSTGEGERPIEMPVHILPTVDFTGFDNVFNSAYVPKVVCAMEMGASEKFPLILGIAQSYKSGPSADEFDLCRITSLSPFHNLTWNGVNNAYDTYWKDWILLEDTQTIITNQWLMTREEVFNIDFTKKLRIDRTDYLLQSFNVALRRNGLSMAECQFVKVPFFREIELPNFTLAWRGVESSLACVRTWIGWKVEGNTGYAAYGYIEQYVVETGLATGVVKENKEGDPDYIAPVENLTMCPTGTGGGGDFITRYLYIQVLNNVTSPQSTISINGVVYKLPNDYPNPVPYPFYMPTGRTTVTVVLSNSTNELEGWRLEAYKGEMMTKQRSVNIHPGNLVRKPRTDYNDPANRTFTFDTQQGDFDFNYYNKLIITRSIV